MMRGVVEGLGVDSDRLMVGRTGLGLRGGGGRAECWGGEQILGWRVMKGRDVR
jgi:hypothetical protein